MYGADDGCKRTYEVEPPASHLRSHHQVRSGALTLIIYLQSIHFLWYLEDPLSFIPILQTPVKRHAMLQPSDQIPFSCNISSFSSLNSTSPARTLVEGM